MAYVRTSCTCRLVCLYPPTSAIDPDYPLHRGNLSICHCYKWLLSRCHPYGGSSGGNGTVHTHAERRHGWTVLGVAVRRRRRGPTRAQRTAQWPARGSGAVGRGRRCAARLRRVVWIWHGLHAGAARAALDGVAIDTTSPFPFSLFFSFFFFILFPFSSSPVMAPCHLRRSCNGRRLDGGDQRATRATAMCTTPRMPSAPARRRSIHFLFVFPFLGPTRGKMDILHGTSKLAA